MGEARHDVVMATPNLASKKLTARQQEARAIVPDLYVARIRRRVDGIVLGTGSK